MRVAVPAGLMPSIGDHGSIRLILCSGTGPMAMAATDPKLLVPKGTAPAQPHAAEICPYASLGLPTMPGADPFVLALALAFIMAAAFRLTPLALDAPARALRPPSRAPPAFS